MQGMYSLNKINNTKYLIEYGYESFCPLEVGCINLKYISNKTALFSLDNYLYFELDTYYNDKPEYNTLINYILESIRNICKEQSIKHLTIQIKENKHLLEIKKILSNNRKGDVIKMLDRHIIKETRLFLETTKYFVLKVNDDHILVSDIDNDHMKYKVYPYNKCECCGAPLMTTYGELIDHYICSNPDCIAYHTTVEDYKEWEAESVLGLVED